MKNLVIFGVFVLILILLQFAQGQTVDDIIDKYIAALGGHENLASLQTVIMEGKITTQLSDLGITNTISHLTGSRLEAEINGIVNYQVANTTKGIVFWPSNGMHSPEEMESGQFLSILNQMDIQGVLLNYKGKGIHVELAGKEEINDSMTYHLKVRFKKGTTSHFYVDIKTSLLVKITEKPVLNNPETEITTYYSNYKQNVDGYWFAYTVTIAYGTIYYEKITTNLPVEESLFDN